jgi:hypothetical protein
VALTHLAIMVELDRFGEACAFTGLQHLGALEAAHLYLSSQIPNTASREVCCCDLTYMRCSA